MGAAPSHASEKLAFDQNLNERVQRMVAGFAKDEIKKDIKDLSIAKADLNEDGLDELILKSAQCGSGAEKTCDYVVVAEAQDKMVEIGAFKARDVRLGNGYSAGIRNILTFANEINDFEYELYVWEPQQSRYILSK